METTTSLTSAYNFPKFLQEQQLGAITQDNSQAISKGNSTLAAVKVSAFCENHFLKVEEVIHYVLLSFYSFFFVGLFVFVKSGLSIRNYVLDKVLTK